MNPVSDNPVEEPVTAIEIGAVGVIELSRPEKFNAMTWDAFRALRSAIDAFEREQSPVRVILLRAKGRHFCTGGDLAEAKSMMTDPEALTEFLTFVNDTLLRLEQSPLPTVAACHGLTLAGGLEMMLCCDIAFAAADARFGDQHVQYGLIPAWGGTQRIPRAVGLRRGLDLMYSGRWIDSATALDWGLVNQVVADDNLARHALEYCTTLATRSRPGVRAMKSLARMTADAPLEQGLDAERELVVQAMQCDDPAEGISAFEARRPPRFVD